MNQTGTFAGIVYPITVKTGLHQSEQETRQCVGEYSSSVEWTSNQQCRWFQLTTTLTPHCGCGIGRCGPGGIGCGTGPDLVKRRYRLEVLIKWGIISNFRLHISTVILPNSYQHNQQNRKSFITPVALRYA